MSRNRVPTEDESDSEDEQGEGLSAAQQEASPVQTEQQVARHKAILNLNIRKRTRESYNLNNKKLFAWLLTTNFPPELMDSTTGALTKLGCVLWMKNAKWFQAFVIQLTPDDINIDAANIGDDTGVILAKGVGSCAAYRSAINKYCQEKGAQQSKAYKADMTRMFAGWSRESRCLFCASTVNSNIFIYFFQSLHTVLLTFTLFLFFQKIILYSFTFFYSDRQRRRRKTATGKDHGQGCHGTCNNACVRAGGIHLKYQWTVHGMLFVALLEHDVPHRKCCDRNFPALALGQ